MLIERDRMVEGSRLLTGQEAFAEIRVVEDVGLEYRKTPTGFKTLVAIPFDLLGLEFSTGQSLKTDLSYLYGNVTGAPVAARSYWSQTASVPTSPTTSPTKAAWSQPSGGRRR